MTFQAFLDSAWNDHAADPAGVMERFPAALDLLQVPIELPGYSSLVVHVAGEHLGRWNDGVALLERVVRLPIFRPNTAEGKAVWRSMAVLHHCAGNKPRALECEVGGRTGGAVPAASDRARILAIAASALAGQNRVDDAIAAFDEALSLISYGPRREDPVARALAVTGNNLACAIEEKPARTARETALMLKAATAARKYWEIAGTWLETERAEFRLSYSYRTAGDWRRALAHGKTCLDICRENDAEPYERFYANVAISRAWLDGKDVQRAASARNECARLAAQITDPGLAAGVLDALDKLNGWIGDGGPPVEAPAPATPAVEIADSSDSGRHEGVVPDEPASAAAEPAVEPEVLSEPGDLTEPAAH